MVVENAGFGVDAGTGELFFSVVGSDVLVMAEINLMVFGELCAVFKLGVLCAWSSLKSSE